ncbi:hypothetical protein U9M48_028487 [Paspalum notatum var. saurae]|uniref:Reverse transcriptase zinc-binding domain-containing protein n=1 Tax=Paspalum notatum var. saurae TaxID=547442 RepID=A0AAQ3U1C9_PASNO
MALFDIAVDTTVGNGSSTKFWADRWLQGSLAELAPNLFSAIPTKAVQRRTVSQALNYRRWVDDIKGALSVQVIAEYLLICRGPSVFLPGSGVCPTRRPAPSVTKEEESIKHILSACVLSREVWAWVLRELRLDVALPPSFSSRFCSWWSKADASLEKGLRKGFNSLVILVIWELWKHRNACVFDGVRPQAQTVLSQAVVEGHMWCLAGASSLQELLLRSAPAP